MPLRLPTNARDADDGDLRARCGHTGNAERPLQFELRHIGRGQTGRGSGLRSRVPRVDAPAVPGRAGERIARRRACRAVGVLADHLERRSIRSGRTPGQKRRHRSPLGGAERRALTPHAERAERGVDRSGAIARSASRVGMRGSDPSWQPRSAACRRPRRWASVARPTPRAGRVRRGCPERRAPHTASLSAVAEARRAKAVRTTILRDTPPTDRSSLRLPSRSPSGPARPASRARACRRSVSICASISTVVFGIGSSAQSRRGNT